MSVHHPRTAGRWLAPCALALLLFVLASPAARAASSDPGTAGGGDPGTVLGVREGDPDMPETGPRPGRTLTTSSAGGQATPVDGRTIGRPALEARPARVPSWASAWLHGLLRVLSRAR